MFSFAAIFFALLFFVVGCWLECITMQKREEKQCKQIKTEWMQKKKMLFVSQICILIFSLLFVFLIKSSNNKKMVANEYMLNYYIKYITKSNGGIAEHHSIPES